LSDSIFNIAAFVKGWLMITKCIWKSWLIFASILGGFASGIMPQQAGATPATKEIVIVAYGDSLTAGYELPPDDAFPVQLERALKSKGHKVQVIDSGVSGDTAADGLARFDWAMPETADAVILELGANDALRGIPVKETKKALSEILSRLKARGISVLIAGMEAPRNWGEDYANEFRAMYASLAEQYGAQLYPFFLDGAALDLSLNLGDGLHPNAKGVAIIVDRIMPEVERLIEAVKARRTNES
jgi:acyl-CoA thioesterase-1